MLQQVQKSMTVLLFIAVSFDCVVAQKVFNNSRAGNPLGGRTTGTFSFSTGGGSRWGSPSTSGFGSSSRRPNSSPKWNLRPTYNSSRSATSRYDAASFARGRSLSYSSAPRSSRSYSTYAGPVQYQRGHSNRHLHPYDQARFGIGLPLQYSYGNGFVAPPTIIAPPAIIAPPIVIPFGGITSSFLPPQPNFAPVPSTVQHQLPPAQLAPAQALPNPTPQNPVFQDGEMLSQKIPSDDTPIVSEFGGPSVNSDVVVPAADRVRSLRYQTSGDSAFRRQDYGSAAVFFKAAAETAPGRRASWVRLAWANVAQQNFEDAVANLKTGLAVSDDPANSWIAGDDLYGSYFATNGDRHNDKLWDWLQQRPNSTDRLLLVAGFQQMRGYPGMAAEMLDSATETGLDLNIARAMQEITNKFTNEGSGQQRAETQPSPFAPPATSDSQTLPQPEIRTSDEPGIRMEGRSQLLPDTQLPIIGDPQALPNDAELPEQTDFSQEAKTVPLVPEFSGVRPMSLQIPVTK